MEDTYPISKKELLKANVENKNLIWFRYFIGMAEGYIRRYKEYTEFNREYKLPILWFDEELDKLIEKVEYVENKIELELKKDYYEDWK